MLKYAIAVGIGAVGGGLSVWGLSPDADADTPEREERTEGGSAEPQRTEEGRVIRDAPQSLTECRQTLVRREVELRTAQTQAARAISGQLFDDEDGPEPPSGTGSRGGAGAEGGEAGTDGQPSERQRFREASRKVREALVSELGISSEEQNALGDVVCPQREAERGLYYDFASGDVDAATMLQTIREDRAKMTEGMRQALGRERYNQLRSLGGIGIISRGLCNRR